MTVKTNNQLREVAKITANLTRKTYRTAFTTSSTGKMASSIRETKKKNGAFGMGLSTFSVKVNTPYALSRDMGWKMRNGVKHGGPKILMRNYFGAVKRVSKGGKWEAGFKG